MILRVAKKTGLKIQVIVVRFPLIGLALGFLAPSRPMAEARSNLARELPILSVASWIESVGLKIPPAAK